MMIQQPEEPISLRELRQQAHRDVLVSRAIIMIFVALAIFAGGLWCVFDHADSQPWWMGTKEITRR